MNMYRKTSNGQQEINANEAGLSMMERRILILINGENDVAAVTKLSLCDDIDSVLQRLLELELIEPASGQAANDAAPVAETTETTETTVPTTPGAAEPAADDGAELNGNAAEAREFMCNTLQTFGNHARIAGLHNEIAETTEVGTLKGLVKPWYQAIADTPGGMYQADDLRKDVLKLLDAA